MKIFNNCNLLRIPNRNLAIKLIVIAVILFQGFWTNSQTRYRIGLGYGHGDVVPSKHPTLTNTQYDTQQITQILESITSNQPQRQSATKSVELILQVWIRMDKTILSYANISPFNPDFTSILNVATLCNQYGVKMSLQIDPSPPQYGDYASNYFNSVYSSDILGWPDCQFIPSSSYWTNVAKPYIRDAISNLSSYIGVGNTIEEIYIGNEWQNKSSQYDIAPLLTDLLATAESELSNLQINGVVVTTKMNSPWGTYNGFESSDYNSIEYYSKNGFGIDLYPTRQPTLSQFESTNYCYYATDDHDYFQSMISNYEGARELTEKPISICETNTSATDVQMTSAEMNCIYTYGLDNYNVRTISFYNWNFAGNGQEVDNYQNQIIGIKSIFDYVVPPNTPCPIVAFNLSNKPIIQVSQPYLRQPANSLGFKYSSGYDGQYVKYNASNLSINGTCSTPSGVTVSNVSFAILFKPKLIGYNANGTLTNTGEIQAGSIDPNADYNSTTSPISIFQTVFNDIRESLNNPVLRDLKNGRLVEYNNIVQGQSYFGSPFMSGNCLNNFTIEVPYQTFVTLCALVQVVQNGVTQDYYYFFDVTQNTVIANQSLQTVYDNNDLYIDAGTNEQTGIFPYANFYSQSFAYQNLTGSNLNSAYTGAYQYDITPNSDCFSGLNIVPVAYNSNSCTGNTNIQYITNYNKIPCPQSLPSGARVENSSSNNNKITPTSINKVNIGVFPNPSSGIFIVTTNTQELDSANLTITDITGNKVYSAYYTFSNPSEINLSAFSKGLYIIQAQTSKGTFSQKLVVE